MPYYGCGELQIVWENTALRVKHDCDVSAFGTWLMHVEVFRKSLDITNSHIIGYCLYKLTYNRLLFGVC